jgi:hypothetical protein
VKRILPRQLFHACDAPGVLVPSDPYQGPIGSGEYWAEKWNQFTPLAWLRDIAAGFGGGVGPYVGPTVLDRISISQGERWYTWRPEHQSLPLSNADIVSHSANIHTIPSNPEIKKQLRGLREGDIAEMDGSRVEVHLGDGGKWIGSLGPTDTGGGACD